MTAIPLSLSGPFLDRLMRVPYLDRGRTFAGADCYGIIYLTFNGFIGIPLQSFDAIDPNDGEAVEGEVKRQSETWFHVEHGAERAFDVVVMRSVHEVNGKVRGGDCHLGMMTEPGRLIHIEEKNGVSMVRIDHPSVRDRLRRIYRHRALA